MAEGRFIVFNERHDTAAIALLVVDEFQRQGIGTMLIHQLVKLAVRKGVTRFSADVLPENRAGLRFSVARADSCRLPQLWLDTFGNPNYGNVTACLRQDYDFPRLAGIFSSS